MTRSSHYADDTAATLWGKELLQTLEDKSPDTFVALAVAERGTATPASGGKSPKQQDSGRPAKKQEDVDVTSIWRRRNLEC